MPVDKCDFIKFANRNYCVSAHLAERLNEIKESDLFNDLHNIISAAVAALEDRLGKAEDFLGITNLFACNEPLIDFMESVFSTIQEPGTKSPSLLFLDYVSIADSLMQESAKLAELAIANSKINKPAHQLYLPQILEPLKLLLSQKRVLA